MEQENLGSDLTQENILEPVAKVFGELAKTPISELRPINEGATTAIQDLFPEQEIEEKKIKRATAALGIYAKAFTKDELKDLIAQVEYLAETWLDDFERDVFKGLTLRELLHERSGT